MLFAAPFALVGGLEATVLEFDNDELDLVVTQNPVGPPDVVLAAGGGVEPAAR